MICDALLKKYDEVCSLNKLGWFEETKATKNTSIRHSSHHRRTVLQYRFRVSEIQAALRNVFRIFFRSQIVLRLAMHRILLLQLRVSLHTGLPVDETSLFMLYQSRKTTLLCMCFVRLFNIISHLICFFFLFAAHQLYRNTGHLLFGIDIVENLIYNV